MLLLVCSAERDYDMQFWKEELEREINELEKSAAELAVRRPFFICVSTTSCLPVFHLIRRERRLRFFGHVGSPSGHWGVAPTAQSLEETLWTPSYHLAVFLCDVSVSLNRLVTALELTSEPLPSAMDSLCTHITSAAALYFVLSVCLCVRA